MFEVCLPYIIVPRLEELNRREDDTQAATLEWSGRHVSWSIPSDNGLTWLPVEIREEPAGDEALATVDLTRWVGGRYGYSLRRTLNGDAGDACLRRLRITTWVQLAPASLPWPRQGRNAMRLVTGDDYGLSTRVVEVRSRRAGPRNCTSTLSLRRRTTTRCAHDREDTGDHHCQGGSAARNADRLVHGDRSVRYPSTGVCHSDPKPHGVCGRRCREV